MVKNGRRTPVRLDVLLTILRNQMTSAYHIANVHHFDVARVITCGMRGGRKIGDGVGGAKRSEPTDVHERFGDIALSTRETKYGADLTSAET